MAGGSSTAMPEGNVAQGSLSSLAALPLRRGFDSAASTLSETVFRAEPSLERIVPLAARQEPAPLEKPQGRRAGPALPGRTPMFARPFAMKEPLTTRYAW
jgi:hypothetical protein